MFAVIRTGGKQYRVSENARIEVERLTGNPGDTITFDDVLMVGGSDAPSMIGKAAVGTATVFAELLAQTRSDKILIFKKKRRKNHRRMRGHRQDLTLLRIIGISPSGEMPVAAAETSPAKGEGDQAAPARDEGENGAAAFDEDEAGGREA